MFTDVYFFFKWMAKRCVEWPLLLLSSHGSSFWDLLLWVLWCFSQSWSSKPIELYFFIAAQTEESLFQVVREQRSCASSLFALRLSPAKTRMTWQMVWLEQRQTTYRLRAIMEGLIQLSWWFFFCSNFFSTLPAPHPPHLCACKCSRELTEYLSMDTAQDRVQTIIKKEYYTSGYLTRPGWFNASHFNSGHLRVT